MYQIQGFIILRMIVILLLVTNYWVDERGDVCNSGYKNCLQSKIKKVEKRKVDSVFREEKR